MPRMSTTIGVRTVGFWFLDVPQQRGGGVEERVPEVREPRAHVAQEGVHRDVVLDRQRVRLCVAFAAVEAPLPEYRAAAERRRADEQHLAHSQLVHPLKSMTHMLSTEFLHVMYL